jgi:hypothetical protein
MAAKLTHHGGQIIYVRLNYQLHPLSLVKVHFSPLSFGRFNLVL